MNILVIEDDKLTLHSLKYSIESLGHQVTLAENAEEAISKITDEKFDLIISDIMMPGISGLSLVSILLSVHLCNTPIIAMSALGSKTLLDAAYEAGVNDFLLKPFTTESLSEKINKFSKEVHEEENK